MYLEKNIGILKKYFSGIPWDNFRDFGKGSMTDMRVKPLDSKSGLPTLVYEGGDSSIYIHSKYDPAAEAQRFAEQHKDGGNEENAVFFGVGLGYHIEEFVRLNPKIQCSIYEPLPEIFYHFLNCRDLSEFPIESLSNIYIDNFFQNSNFIKYSFMNKIGYSFDVIVLPSYERIFFREYKDFVKALSESLRDKRVDIMSKYVQAKEWNRNIIMNLNEVIGSKNFLHMDKDMFRGKPAILVSSGPSLQDEVENLKYIKEKGLAYIFSAGSAIQAMLELGIHPDAAFAFDSKQANMKLFKKLVEGEVNDVALIFSPHFYSDVVKSCGCEKYHFILKQDKISQYYIELENERNLNTVIGAPSIAVVLLQVLHFMEFDPIILVGQNFAYRDSQFYSRGIDNESHSSVMTEKDKSKVFTVEDVYGGRVYTEENLDIMRRQMSTIIELMSMNNVINTTRGGAKIEGTSFETLDSLIKSRLHNRAVNMSWQKSRSDAYNKEYIKEKALKLIAEKSEASNIIRDMDKVLRQISGVSLSKTDNQVSRLFSRFSELYGKLVKNKFYDVFLVDMSVIQHELVNQDLQQLNRETSMIRRAHAFAEKFGPLIATLKIHYEYIDPLFEEANKKILENA